MNNSDAKENLPTEQPPPREETRVSRTDGDQERASRDCASSRERSQTSDSTSLLKTTEAPEKLDFNLPKAHRLRRPREFQTVYKNGKRFDERFMSAFVLPNELQNHRLGITASRKGVGKAYQRNRAKRLLREAFRLSKIELNALQNKYDFVLNARRALLSVKIAEPLADFHKIVRQIAAHENLLNNEKTADVNLTAE